MSNHYEQAYTRGVRAAGIWKRLKHTVASWDQRGAAWAKNHNIPVWIGRVPLVAAILISLTGLIAGGFIVAFIVAFIWAMAFILQNVDLNSIDDDSKPTGPGYRYGQDGYGYYSGSDDITSERID
ncbi:hypothetical protein [Klebsiella aerogenes]|uniref:DUF3742 family protein n=1 Tax=Klebsiella aerogenes TaxID=548 RepID=A0AAP9R2M3_KLEAE|nr:hypothetical protein [Klebsiella aerogenes]QMR42929.1 hypothetical protein HV331_25805 [Klebsiella aerogenes]